MSRQYYCKRCSGELDEVHQRLDALEKRADFHNRRLGALESRGAGWNQAEESWREHPAQPPPPADPGEKWRERVRAITGGWVSREGAEALAVELQRADYEGYSRGIARVLEYVAAVRRGEPL